MSSNLSRKFAWTIILALALAVFAFAAVTMAQSPPEEDNQIAATSLGPATDPCTATPGAGAASGSMIPRVEISGLAQCVEINASDSFTVETHNLDEDSQYQVALSISTSDEGSMGFDAACAATTATLEISGEAPSATLYGCSGTAGAWLPPSSNPAGPRLTRPNRYCSWFRPSPNR